MDNKILITGENVYLAEIEPKYFPYVIEWRNDPENHKFLNQPFILTMEKQSAWYDKYIKDPSQGLLIMVAKTGDIPFGTIGWTDYDADEKVCISGRLLVGDYKYRSTAEQTEAMMLYMKFLYETLGVDYSFAHVVKENKKVLSYNKKMGFKENKGDIRYPHELFVNGMNQVELIRSRADYKKGLDRFDSILKVLNDL